MPADATLTSEQRRVIADLKSDQRSISLPILGPDDGAIGRLTPVTPSLAARTEVVQSLCRWRATHALSFLTVFTPTPDNVRDYLVKYSLPDPARVLFLVQDDGGRLVGNIGFCNIAAESAELDNVLRGEPANPVRLMTDAQTALLDWAFRILRVQGVYLQVLAANTRAIRLYERIGFATTGQVGLTRVPQGDGYRLVPAGPTDLDPPVAHLKRMEITSDQFYAAGRCGSAAQSAGSGGDVAAVASSYRHGGAGDRRR